MTFEIGLSGQLFTSRSIERIDDRYRLVDSSNTQQLSRKAVWRGEEGETQKTVGMSVGEVLQDARPLTVNIRNRREVNYQVGALLARIIELQADVFRVGMIDLTTYRRKRKRRSN